MIELPDGKISRTLPEQVGFLSEQVQRIFRFLDGINVQDNVVVVDNIATPLTAEELVIVNRDVAFLVYSGQLYIKKSVSGSTAYFDVVFSISAGTTITFNSSEIQVNLSNGGMSLVSNSPATYSKAQIDTLLSAKADITYVDSQLVAGLATKANLSGANFTGAITAPSIIEDMEGYSFVGTASTAEHTINYVYCSAVKNGNKITLVWFVSLTYISGSGEFSLGRFALPTAVMNAIYPIPFSGNTAVVDFKSVQALSSVNSATPLNVSIRKYSNGITLFVMNANSLTANTEYMVRVEETFLLSDNFAS